MADPSDPADELPLAQDVARSLDRLDTALAGLIHIAPALATAMRKPDTASWSRPGPALPPRNAGVYVKPVPGLPPLAMLSRWRSGGPLWMRKASRREIRAAQVALASVEIGPTLASDAGFLSELMHRLRPGQRGRAAIAAAFVHYPPTLPAMEALADAIRDRISRE